MCLMGMINLFVSTLFFLLFVLVFTDNNVQIIQTSCCLMTGNKPLTTYQKKIDVHHQGRGFI